MQSATSAAISTKRSLLFRPDKEPQAKRVKSDSSPSVTEEASKTPSSQELQQCHIANHPGPSVSYLVNLLKPETKAEYLGFQKGGFGSVSTFRTEKGTFAVKHITKLPSKSPPIPNELTLPQVYEGIPGIVHILETGVVGNSFYIVMEGLATDLFSLLHTRKLSDDECKSLCKTLAQVLDSLIERRIHYRDIKPENVMFDLHGEVKLIDFDLAKYYEEKEPFHSFTICGTSEFMAPEILKPAGYGPKSDVWALGILLVEAATLLSPFASGTPIQIVNFIRDLTPGLVSARVANCFGPSGTLMTIALDLLQVEPNLRLSARGVAEHREFAAVGTTPFKNLPEPDLLQGPRHNWPFGRDTAPREIFYQRPKES